MGQHGLWRRRSIAKRTVRSDGIVVAAPALDQHLCFLQSGKDLPVEQLIPELAIEALVVSVFLGRPRLYLQGPNADMAELVADNLGRSHRTRRVLDTAAAGARMIRH